MAAGDGGVGAGAGVVDACASVTSVTVVSVDTGAIAGAAVDEVEGEDVISACAAATADAKVGT